MRLKNHCCKTLGQWFPNLALHDNHLDSSSELPTNRDHNQPWLSVQLVTRIKTQHEAPFTHLNGHKAQLWPLSVLVSPIYPESSDLLALSELLDHSGRKTPNLFLISAETRGVIFGYFHFQTGNRKSHYQGLWGHEHFWLLLIACIDFLCLYDSEWNWEEKSYILWWKTVVKEENKLRS